MMNDFESGEGKKTDPKVKFGLRGLRDRFQVESDMNKTMRHAEADAKQWGTMLAAADAQPAAKVDTDDQTQSVGMDTSDGDPREGNPFYEEYNRERTSAREKRDKIVKDALNARKGNRNANVG